MIYLSQHLEKKNLNYLHDMTNKNNVILHIWNIHMHIKKSFIQNKQKDLQKHQ